VLLSDKDYQFYTGFTNNLEKRIEKHNSGKVESTKNRRPLKLVYVAACLSKDDAIHREKYLKTTYGRRYIRNRLKNYLSQEI